MFWPARARAMGLEAARVTLPTCKDIGVHRLRPDGGVMASHRHCVQEEGHLEGHLLATGVQIKAGSGNIPTYMFVLSTWTQREIIVEKFNSFPPPLL